jgi:hypothetical protein
VARREDRPARRRVRRLAVVGFVAVVLSLVGGPAGAHEVGGVGATNFQTTLTTVNPAVPSRAAVRPARLPATSITRLPR